MLLSEPVFGNLRLNRNPIIFQIINLLFEKLTLQIKTIHSDSFADDLAICNIFYGHKTGIKNICVWVIASQTLTQKLHY